MLLVAANRQGFWRESYFYTDLELVVTLALVILSLALGALMVKAWCFFWKRLWIGVLGVGWLVVSVGSVFRIGAPLIEPGLSFVYVVLGCTMALSLWFAYLKLVWGQIGRPLESALLSGLPIVAFILALLCSTGACLVYGPIIALSGVFFAGSDFSEDELIESITKVFEGIAQLVLAWGVVLAFGFFLLELTSRQLLHAFFIGLSYLFGAWMSAGLVWGFSTYLGSNPLRRVLLAASRGLFGVPR